MAGSSPAITRGKSPPQPLPTSGRGTLTPVPGPNPPLDGEGRTVRCGVGWAEVTLAARQHEPAIKVQDHAIDINIPLLAGKISAGPVLGRHQPHP